MGWLSAIGQGGQQGLDRYSQWRQLDQKNQWEERDRQRQATLDAAAEKDRELQARATRQAILKNQIGMTAPGTALKPEQVAEYAAEGMGGLFGEGGVFQGTYEQREAKRQADMAQKMHELTVRGQEGQLADADRNRAANVALDGWLKANPTATPEQALQKTQEFGVTQLNPATQMYIEQKHRTQLQRMSDAASVAAAQARHQQDAANAEKVRLKPLQDLRRTLPNSLSELWMDTSGKTLLSGELPSKEVQAGVLNQWGAVAPQLRRLDKELGVGGSQQVGSDMFVQAMDALPATAAQYILSESDPTEMFERINAGPFSDPEKHALRAAAREIFAQVQSKLKLPDPYTGNEPKAGPAAAPGGGRPISADQLSPQARYGGGLPSRSAGLVTSHNPLASAIRPVTSHR